MSEKVQISFTTPNGEVIEEIVEKGIGIIREGENRINATIPDTCQWALSDCPRKPVKSLVIAGFITWYCQDHYRDAKERLDRLGKALR